MFCDRCQRKLPFAKPVHTCSIVNSCTYNWVAYTLCDQCKDELYAFLGPGVSNLPKPEESHEFLRPNNFNLPKSKEEYNETLE